MTRPEPEDEPEDEANDGALPWEEANDGNARSFAEREEQAVAALGKRQEIQNTLRGAPDTIKLGAQTWKPPDHGPSESWPPLDDLDDADARTDVTPGKRLSGAVVSEEAPEVAGVIRSDDGPAQIVDPVPESVSVSPSVAVEMRQARAAPIPTTEAPTEPIPKFPRPTPEQPREATPLPQPRSYGPPPLPGPPPMSPPGDATALVSIEPSSSSVAGFIAVALISALLGLGAGFALWGMKSESNAPEPNAAAAPAPPPVAEPRPAPATVAEPDDSAPPPCTLAVRSEPSGAEVRIAGEVVGTTPLDVDRACGDVSVEIAKERYAQLDRAVKLEADHVGVVAVTLERPMYKVVIRSVPRGAEVAVAGKKLGKTPLTIELPGYEKAEIELTRRGYRPYKKKITPTRKRTRLKPRLRRR